MTPSYWGEALWTVMYAIAYNYTSEDSISISQFYNLLKSVIPCDKCRAHYAKLVENHPLDPNALANKQSLLQWVNLIHNETNKSLGKPTVSLDDRIKAIENNDEVKKVISDVEISNTTAEVSNVPSVPTAEVSNAIANVTKHVHITSKQWRLRRQNDKEAQTVTWIYQSHMENDGKQGIRLIPQPIVPVQPPSYNGGNIVVDTNTNTNTPENPVNPVNPVNPQETPKEIVKDATKPNLMKVVGGCGCRR